MSSYEINQQAEEDAFDSDVELTDNEVLSHTKSIKLRLLQKMAGVDMSTDPKEVAALMKVADSLDKTALTNIRNNIEQDSNASVAEALNIIASMQRQVGNTDPFMVDVSKGGELKPREISIEHTLVEHDFVEGELSHESRDLQYDGFVNDFEANPPKI